MTILTRSSYVSMDVNSAMHASMVSGLTAGSVIAAGDACYIDAEGLVQPCVNTVTNSGSQVTAFIGFAPKAYALGDAMSLYGHGARFGYAADMTPGTPLFTSGSAGYLSDVATEFTLSTISGSATKIKDLAVAVAINATDIFCIR